MYPLCNKEDSLYLRRVNPQTKIQPLMKRLLSNLAKRVLLTAFNFLIYLSMVGYGLYTLLHALVVMFISPERFYKSFRYEINYVADKLVSHE